MKIGKKSLLPTALICGLLIAPTPSFAYREFVDNGTPCVEATYENGQINYSLAKPITIHVDGKYIPSDVDPTIRSGRTMVPLRAAGEALGAQVNWDQGTQTAIAVKDDRTVQFQLYNQTYYVNGQAYHTDVAPTMTNNRTLLPLRVFAESLSADVYWDQNTYDVQIDTPAQNAPEPTVPANLTREEAEWFKKYYVPADSSDPLLGSWHNSNTSTWYLNNNPATPVPLYIDSYQFVSKYNGKYQTISVSFSRFTSQKELWMSVGRDKNTLHYTQNGLDVYVHGYEPEFVFYRGPGIGSHLSYGILVLDGDHMTQIGSYHCISNEYLPLPPEYQLTYTKM